MAKSIDNIWEQIHKNHAWGGYPSEHVIRFVARNFHVSDRASIKILDFGCGQGAHTWYLAREGYDTFAFDGSESAVSKCRKRLENEGLSAKFVVADATELNYEANFFDAIIDNVCIYANRMDDIRTMFATVLKMLKPGGKFLTVCFGEDLTGYQSGEEIEPGTFQNIKEGVLINRGLSHIFMKDELCDLLAKIGFVNIQCDWSKYSDNGNIVHHYICIGEKA